MKNSENKKISGETFSAVELRQETEDSDAPVSVARIIDKLTKRNKNKGMLMVVSAPSGAGKTTLCRKLVRDMERAVFSISVTSRPPRGEEKDGHDYIFVSEEEFKEKIKAKELIEWAEVHNRYYGTSRTFVQNQLDRGKYVILDIDVQGGMQIKKKFSSAVLVFVLPPSFKELKKRIENRKSDSPGEIEKRLLNAREEIKKAPEYDYMLVNTEVDKAVSELKSIITAEKLRT